MHSERAPFFLKLAAWGGVVFKNFYKQIKAPQDFKKQKNRVFF